MLPDDHTHYVTRGSDGLGRAINARTGRVVASWRLDAPEPLPPPAPEPKRPEPAMNLWCWLSTVFSLSVVVFVVGYVGLHLFGVLPR